MNIYKNIITIESLAWSVWSVY